MLDVETLMDALRRQATQTTTKYDVDSRALVALVQLKTQERDMILRNYVNYRIHEIDQADAPGDELRKEREYLFLHYPHDQKA